MRVKQGALAFLGLYVCLIATISHRHTATVGGIELPWGVALGLVAAYTIARTGEEWVRMGGAFFGLGWAIGVALPMFVPGDSYLVAGDWLGLLFMLGSFAALAIAVLRSTHRLQS